MIRDEEVQPSGPKLIFGALPDRQPEGRNRPFAVLSHRDGGRPLCAKKRSLPNGPLGGAGEAVNGGARRWSGAQCDPHHSEKPLGGCTAGFVLTHFIANRED